MFACLSRPHPAVALQLLRVSPSCVPSRPLLVPAASSSSFHVSSSTHCDPSSTHPLVVAPWLVSRAPPVGVSPLPGSAHSVHPDSSPHVVSSLCASLLLPLLPSFAPTRPPVHWLFPPYSTRVPRVVFVALLLRPSKVGS
jgi:hypothetical protein